MISDCISLEDYMSQYGTILGNRTAQAVEPLHRPGTDPLIETDIMREPFEAQAHVITSCIRALHRQKTLLLVAECGTGKAQPLDAAVLTPNGFKAMGEIAVGDTVVDPDGGTGTVLGVYPQGEKDVFRITFSDGSFTECCDDHLWLVQTPERRWRNHPPQVRPLSELRASYFGTHVRSSGELNRRYWIPMVQPVQFDAPCELPITPYVLGVLLGDGCIKFSRTMFSTPDEQVVHMVANELPSSLTVKKVPGDNVDYCIWSGPSKPNVVTRALRKLGLHGCGSAEKFVPPMYKLASVNDRLAILQGLLDTDGYAEKHSVEYATASEQLAKDVVWITQSLGGTASVTSRFPGYPNAKLSWRVRVKLPNGMSPFRLTRKAGGYEGEGRCRVQRAIVSIEHVGREQCQCIAVSTKRQLYVTDNFIVTHNTILSMATCHGHADGKPYRAIVMVPPHLVTKWQREIAETIPKARITILKTYYDVTRLERSDRPVAPEWFIVSQTSAKMCPKWKPCYVLRKRPVGVPFCPGCGEAIVKTEGKEKREIPVPVADLEKKRHTCPTCGEQLWQWTRSPDRWPIARYINRRLRGYFDYFIVDEVHQAKGEDTAIATNMSRLVSACRKVIALTGTLIGGYASHLRTMLYRLSPGSLIADGLSYTESNKFVERYGRIETTVYESGKKGDFRSDNVMSEGKKGNARTTRSAKPGVMPSLFGKHLIDKCVFLSLNEVAEGLPELTEEIVPVAMDAEQAAAYTKIENALRDSIRDMVQRGDRRLLGTMLKTLIGYCDFPYEREEIGYYTTTLDKQQKWVSVVTPDNLSADVVRPKEQALIDRVAAEVDAGRQCWVFTNMTNKYDVLARLETLMKVNGFRVKVMRSDVGTDVREEWIEAHGPEVDVILSHPGLVETGVDLFDKAGSYNFTTLIFYQTGYGLFTLRQASRRSWRIGQVESCRVLYLYYADTMQSRAMTLMGRKLAAAEAIEGKFSSEGLTAMGGEDASMEIALAQSLVDRLDDMDPAREWGKISKMPTQTRTLQVLETLIRQEAALANVDPTTFIEQLYLFGQE